jgi:hypothetical protein
VEKYNIAIGSNKLIFNAVVGVSIRRLREFLLLSKDVLCSFNDSIIDVRMRAFQSFLFFSFPRPPYVIIFIRQSLRARNSK